MKFNKIIIGIMILLIISLCGNFYLMINRNIVKEIQVSDSTEEYDAKYSNFDKDTKDVQLSIYEGALDSATSPTEVKYLLLKMAPNLSDSEKDDAVAKYINHLQYFASTYTNVALMYQNILNNLSSTIDFSKRDAAYKVSDKVLRNLLLEIWDSDMILYLPDDTSKAPSVLVDYDGIRTTYADFITSTTDKYLDLKAHIINGEISNTDGTINYDNLKDYMDSTYSFIQENPDFAIIDDVKYMYVVASKMFFDVYMNDDSTITYDDTSIARIKEYVDSHDGTPAATIGNMILEDVQDDGVLSEDTYTQVQSQFSALAS